MQNPFDALQQQAAAVGQQLAQGVQGAIPGLAQTATQAMQDAIPAITQAASPAAYQLGQQAGAGARSGATGDFDWTTAGIVGVGLLGVLGVGFVAYKAAASKELPPT